MADIQKEANAFAHMEMCCVKAWVIAFLLTGSKATSNALVNAADQTTMLSDFDQESKKVTSLLSFPLADDPQPEDSRRRIRKSQKTYELSVISAASRYATEVELRSTRIGPFEMQLGIGATDFSA